MSNDGSARRPTRLPAGRHRRRRRGRRPGQLARCPARGRRRRRSAPSMAAIFISDPDRAGPAARRVARDGRRQSRPPGAAEVARSGPPVHDRRARPDDDLRSRGRRSRRRAVVRRRLPAPASCRAAAWTSPSGSFGMALAGAADAGRRRARDADRRWPSLAAVAVDRARLASTASERSEWFERMAHTDPLTGLANERTVARILELEIARAGAPGQRAVARAVRRRRLPVDQRERAAPRPAMTSSGRSRRSSPRSVRLVDTVGADRRRRVRPGGPGFGRRDGRSAGPRRDRRAAGRRRQADVGVGRASLASRSTASDAEALIAAATAALVAGPGRRVRATVAETGVAAEG